MLTCGVLSIAGSTQLTPQPHDLRVEQRESASCSSSRDNQIPPVVGSISLLRLIGRKGPGFDEDDNHHQKPTLDQHRHAVAGKEDKGGGTLGVINYVLWGYVMVQSTGERDQGMEAGE